MKKEQQIYWTVLKQGESKIYVAATSSGLCYIGSPNAEFKELDTWAKKRLPTYKLLKDEEQLRPYTKEIQAYLEGQSTAFTVAIDLYGTPFQQRVWQELQALIYGQTVTYTEIAERIGKPKSVRAVASAIGANPVLFVVPCHRVIAKNGTLGGFRAGIEMKKQLLVLENARPHQ